MKGNYILKIRNDLPQPLRIAQFANEPISFHLHKKRDFLPRLEGKQPKEVTELEKAKKEFKRKVKHLKRNLEQMERKSTNFIKYQESFIISRNIS